MLEFPVRARVGVKVRARVRKSWGTKRLGTKRLGTKCLEALVTHPFTYLRSVRVLPASKLSRKFTH